MKLLKIAALIFLVPVLFLTACTPSTVLPDDTGKTQETDLTFVKDGNAEYSIVISANATLSEKFASSELQKYIKQISGAELPIITDETVPAEKEISVGKTNRISDCNTSAEAFLLETVGNRVNICGDDHGVIYGVYGFLEDYLGCRFFTSDCEKIPSMKTVKIDPIQRVERAPFFEYRNCYWTSYGDDVLRMKRGLNTAYFDSNYYADKGGSLEFTISRCHTFGRLNTGSHSFTNQPCLSDETVFQRMLTNALSYIDENTKIVSISQDDGAEFCQCDACKAKYEKYGSKSGAVIEFVNRMAVEIAKQYPNVLIHTFAYRNTETAPLNITVADNVIVEICSISCCFSHALTDTSCQNGANAAFIKNVEDWTKICKHVYVWDYTTDFSHYAMPFPNLHTIRDNMQFFDNIGIAGIFEQGNYQSVSGELGELRCYLLSKLMWDPYMSEEKYDEIMNEFLSYYYGDGWQNIKDAILYTEEYTKDKDLSIYSSPDEIYDIIKVNTEPRLIPEFTEEMQNNPSSFNWKSIGDGICTFKFDFFEKFKGYWDKALNESKTEVQKEHVRRSRIQSLYLQSYFNYLEQETYFKNIKWYLQMQYLDPEVDLAILNIATEQVNKDIVEFNTMLYDEVNHFGLTNFCEWSSISAQPKLYNIPMMW